MLFLSIGLSYLVLWKQPIMHLSNPQNQTYIKYIAQKIMFSYVIDKIKLKRWLFYCRFFDCLIRLNDCSIRVFQYYFAICDWVCENENDSTLL